MVALSFIIAYSIGYLFPTFGEVTPYGMKAIGAFVGLLFCWVTVDLNWGTIFGFFIIAAFGLMGPAAVVAEGLGNATIGQSFACMAFAAATNQMGVTDVIATTLLKQKIVHKNPWFLVIGIILITAFVCTIGPVIATIFLMYNLITKISDMTGYEKGDKFVTFMIFIVTTVGFTTALILPFRGSAIMWLGFVKTAVPDLTYNTGSFILVATLVCFCLFAGCCLFAKFVVHIDVSKFVLPEELLMELQEKKFSLKEKWAVVILFVYILLLILPEFFVFPGSAWLKSLGIVGISFIGLLVPAILKFDGEPMIDVGLAIRNVDWTLILLIAVALPMSTLMRSEEAGIMPTVMGIVKPLVSGMGVNTFMIASTLILLLLTQVTHNVVLGAMFMPFICPLCAEMGGSLFASWFLLYFALSLAYMTPAGSMNAAMIFGHSYSSRKYAYIYGIGLTIIGAIVLSALSPLIAAMMG